MRQGLRVVDADTHVNPSLEVLLRYADQALLDRLDELKPHCRVTTTRDGAQQTQLNVNTRGRLADMDAEGRDIDVIIPGAWAYGASALEPSLACTLFAAYHRYIADYCSADARRLKSFITVPGAD